MTSIHHGIAATRGYVTELRSTDVLLGRGSRIDQHAGNMHFRTQVAQRKAAYAATSNNDHKKQVADAIIAGIRERSGRFLHRVVSPPDEATQLDIPDGVTGWVEIDHMAAVEKTKQALREKGAANKRNFKAARQMKGSVTAGGTKTSTDASKSAPSLGAAGTPSASAVTFPASLGHALFPLSGHGMPLSLPSSAVSHQELELLHTMLNSSRNNPNHSVLSTPVPSTASPTSMQALSLFRQQLERQTLERQIQEEQWQQQATLQQQWNNMRRHRLEQLLPDAPVRHAPLSTLLHSSIGAMGTGATGVAAAAASCADAPIPSPNSTHAHLEPLTPNHDQAALASLNRSAPDGLTLLRQLHRNAVLQSAINTTHLSHSSHAPLSNRLHTGTHGGSTATTGNSLPTLLALAAMQQQQARHRNSNHA